MRFEPWARSAFRVLGLAASASQAEVFEAAEALRLSARLGVERRLDTDLAWLAPVARDEGGLRDALGRLEDPPRRAAERLFWFYAPPSAPRPETFDALRREAERLLARGGPAARHDSALLLLAALHALDPGLREREAWDAAFRLWREEVEAEEFWSLLVAADLKGEYEQALTFAEAAELRMQTPRLISQALAGAAAREAAAENHAGVGRVLAVLRAASLPRPLIEEYENESLGPLLERAEKVCDLSFGFAPLMAYDKRLVPTDRKERYFDPAVHRFCAEAKPELFKFLDAAGVDSYHFRRLARHAAARLCALAATYRAEGWTAQAAYVYETARDIAPDDTAELAEADAALREMGAAGVEGEGAGGGRAYLVRLTRELGRMRPPSKLFKAPGPNDLGATTRATAKDTTYRSCLLQIAFFVLVVVSCFALDRCGVVKVGRRSSYPPAFNFNASNFNYRVPVPQFSPVPLPDLAPPGAIKSLTPAELRRLIERDAAVIIDVRATEEYEAGHIKGAASVPGGGGVGPAGRRRRRFVFYGDGPGDDAARRAALRLWLAGHKDVAVLSGGLGAWRAAGLPVETSGGVVDNGPPPAAKGN